MKPLRDLLRGLLTAFRDPRVRALMVFTVTLITIASAFYSWAEGWRTLDAVYFSVITIATVGYGDLTPHTDIGKLFTIFYVLIGLGIFVATASSIADAIINERRERYDRDHRK